MSQDERTTLLIHRRPGKLTIITTDKTPYPRCKVCGNLGDWGAPHYCPGPGGLTGTWVEDHGELHHAPRRYEVRFAFEGETTFETLDDAREAAREYERIVADAVHGAEVKRLRAERSRLRMALGGAQAMMIDKGLWDSYSHLWNEICSALAHADEHEEDGGE